MVLSSSAYFIFLVAIFFLYWPVARIRALSLGVILFANYFFYAKWDLFYLALIPAASTCDFLIALWMQNSKAPALRRALVTLSVLLNLGILASFKYMPFLLDNYARLSSRPAPEWHWIFPLGISFYAFQALTYTIDVYRRDAKATSSYLAYLASVSFFPTTLAGPITRVATLFPQFEKKDKTLSSADGGRALFLIALGLTKKLLIADYLADNLVNRVFDFPKLYTGAETLVAVYAYALQLYYDFSGYTDIAIGSALLLGIKLPPTSTCPTPPRTSPTSGVAGTSASPTGCATISTSRSPACARSGKSSRISTSSSPWCSAACGTARAGTSSSGDCSTASDWRSRAPSRAQRPRQSPADGASIGRIFVTVNFVCFAWIFFRSPTLEAALNILNRIGSLTVSFENISGRDMVIWRSPSSDTISRASGRAG